MRALRFVLLALLLPIAAGRAVVTYGDATLNHLPARSVIADELRAGRIPFVHPGSSFGQPLAGNPNYGVFFPDTLLAVMLPLHVAFGLRFAIALLLAFVGARRWARAEGATREAAEVAGLAFPLSGVFLSTWVFFNSGLALAVAPWVLAAATRLVRRAGAGDGRGTRRATAELGLWIALELLAGEPVIALLTFLLAAARMGTSVPMGAPFTRMGLPLAAAGLIGALIAAPQIAATAQILGVSTRGTTGISFAIATGTSVHPVRLVEQAVPFPYGRPDVRGPGGFTGHPSFDRRAPYLWTLHLGLVSLALLVLHGRLGTPDGRLLAALSIAGVALSMGRYLPAATVLHPLLSLGGRIRFPVKWWYVVALAIVPPLAHAADAWLRGERASPARRSAFGVLVLLASVVLATRAPTFAVAAGPILSILAGASLLAARRRAAWLAASVAASLLVSAAPLLNAVLDAPPPAPPRLAGGRLYVRLKTDAHPQPPPPSAEPRAVREFFRRAGPELWPLTATRSGVGYAFDVDADGAYADVDRLARKQVDALPWPERAFALRAAGVSAVVTDTELPAPYREMAVLNRAEGVRLYTLDGAAPSLRIATGVHHAPAHLTVVHETPAQVTADVEADGDTLVMWSRTFFPTWRASVDGKPVVPLRVEGHLVGIPVGAGRHLVEIAWDVFPLAMGAAGSVIGIALAAWRFWGARAEE